MFTVLHQKRCKMLEEEGYVTMEKLEGGEGEAPMLEEEDDYYPPPMEAVMSGVPPPPLYGALFGPDGVQESENTMLICRRLVGFMVYLGVRATADEIAIAREEREDEEAEEDARIARIERQKEEQRARDERERKEWDAANKEKV